MYSVIHEIEFYPVDSAIQPSNNRAQVCIDNAKKKTICGRRARFPHFIQRNTEVIIFQQAQWEVKVNIRLIPTMLFE